MPPAQKQKPKPKHPPQPWALSVHAKSKTFSFKFRIPGYLLPASMPRPSFILKSPHHFRLQLKSVTTGRHWLKSKLCRILAKIRSIKSGSPKNPSSRNPQNKQLLKSKQAPISPPISEIFFPSSPTHNDWSRQKGIRILISVFLYFVKLLFDRIRSQRLSTSLLLLLGSAVSCWPLFRTFQHLCYYDHSVPRRVWSYATSSLDLNAICQAVVSVVLSA